MSENDDFIETTVRSLLGGELDELALKIVTGDDGLDRTILRPCRRGRGFCTAITPILPRDLQGDGASSLLPLSPFFSETERWRLASGAVDPVGSAPV